MRLIVSLSVLLLFAGCATPQPEPVEFPVSPMMAIVSTDNSMIMTWNTERGQTYTVYYSDSPRNTRAEWQPLPQGTRVQGTGKSVSIRDKTSPGSPRRYLLLTGDQKPY